MKKIKLFLLSFLAAAQSLTSQAQLYNQSALNFETDGSIKSMIIDNNFLYLGGNFANAGKFYRHCMKVKNDTFLVDYTFPVFNDTVKSVFSDGHGGAYYFGVFTQVGDSVRNGFAHIDSVNTITPLNITFDNATYIRSIVCIGSEIIVAGDFTSVNGIPIKYLVSLNSATGSVNPTNVPITNNSVYDVKLFDSWIYLSGAFDSVNAVPHKYICKLDLSTRNVSPVLIQPIDSLQFPISDGIERMQFTDSTMFLMGTFRLYFYKDVFDSSLMAYTTINYNTNNGCLELKRSGDSLTLFERSDKIILTTNYIPLENDAYLRNDTLFILGLNYTPYVMQLLPDTTIELGGGSMISGGPKKVLADSNNTIYFIGNHTLDNGFAIFNTDYMTTGFDVNLHWYNRATNTGSFITDAVDVQNGRVFTGNLDYFAMQQRINFVKIDLLNVYVDSLQINLTDQFGFYDPTGSDVLEIAKNNQHQKAIFGTFFTVNDTIDGYGLALLDSADNVIVPQPAMDPSMITYPSNFTINESHVYASGYGNIDSIPSSGVLGIRLNSGDVSPFNSYPCNANSTTIATWKQYVIHFANNTSNPIMVMVDTNATVDDSLSCTTNITTDADYGSICPSCKTNASIVGGNSLYTILIDSLAPYGYILETNLNTLSNTLIDSSLINTLPSDLNSVNFSKLSFLDGHLVTPDYSTYRLRLFDTTSNTFSTTEIELPPLTQTYTFHNSYLFVATWNITFARSLGDSTSKIYIYEIDLDGGGMSVPESNTIAQNDYVIYPNPFSEGSITILNKQLSLVEELAIFDMSGKMILQQEIHSKTEKIICNAPKIESGAYFLRLKTEQGYQTKKLIVK